MTAPRDGTISALEPMDGLGWITLDDGARVRFGGTACKAFVPAIGMRVRVVSTTLGYGGVTKATELASLGATPAAPPPRPSARRASVAALGALGVDADEPLRKVLAKWDSDDAFHADLEKLMFEIAPMRAADLACNATPFTVVAMDGGGSAYGLYLSAESTAGGARPWVYWDHEIDVLRYIAADTAALFTRLIDLGAASGVDRVVLGRVRAVLWDLGIALGAPGSSGAPESDGMPATWLPRIRR